MTDAILVRAPVGAVYRTLTDLDGWSSWLVGCRSVRLPSAAGGEDRHGLDLPLGRRRWRLEVTVGGWRHDAGVVWVVDGAVSVRSEWWLESCPAGTVLHHVVQGEGVGDDFRRLRRHRRAVMHAMQAMKDHLELAVAVAVGRIP